ncbi:polyhydroxyalkanoate depolymerase [Hyphomicrobium sp.]|uniref:polyhydroxyalkanoate depolymerase n=1 Tax=Hyphomicrobium sp. TaxID=82 RepID=UPI002E34A6BD|nr:polyhydroxyalkanoate depolymerase [Hyphomicrobium sp.]HEX2842794.1 polyhydroxyalkanoate depolymerase [Hyphomicrobium sp.]
MHYYTYELAHALLHPIRLMTRTFKAQLETPINPFATTDLAKNMAAACEVFEGMTRRYGKPEFGIKEAKVQGVGVPVREEIVLRKPFCNLLHFDRDKTALGERSDPKVLLIAPMSGHYATLLRGTAEAMIKEHDLYITDWADARDVPLYEGSFDLDDFIDYIIEFIQFLGPNTHVIAVCQPAVPALAATAVMAANDDPCQPASLTMMGGPIDTRRNPTQVNKLAEEKALSWFKNNVIHYVPFPNAGYGRKVYPGFIQLTGFMTMNLERHTEAHMKLFENLVKGDCDSVNQHKAFYEEYLAVMDLPAEFYLQTVKTVFQDHALPKGEMMHRGQRVECSAIRKTAIMTVEGERDDICGLGQTEAAHDLCSNVPPDEHFYYVQQGVGHYGVFSGRRWSTEIQPRIREMIRTIHFKRRTKSETTKTPQPSRPLQQTRENIVDWRAPNGAVNGVASEGSGR